MYILGLGGSNHDYSSCILKDGVIECMIEDERITGNKNCAGMSIELAKGYSKKYCMDYLDIDQIDLIIGNDLLHPLVYKRIKQNITLINHHLAHAASSFYPSDFNEAAILVVDAVGSKTKVEDQVFYESTSFGYGSEKGIVILDQNKGLNIEGTDYIENSLGIFYSIITDVIGFGEHQEGKTMGLAPYGTSKFYQEFLKHIRYKDKGKIEMDADDIQFFLSYKQLVRDCKDNEALRFELTSDLAWAAQKIIEDYILVLGEYLKKITKSDFCCIAGGVALNSVANYKLYKAQIFKKIFMQPACGDSGTSLGSALYGYHVLTKTYDCDGE